MASRVCTHCGELYPQKRLNCPHCGQEADAPWAPAPEGFSLDTGDISDAEYREILASEGLAAPPEPTRAQAGCGAAALLWGALLIGSLALLL